MAFRRRYSFTQGGDLTVIDWPDDDVRRDDISKEYENIAKDWVHARLVADIEIDVTENLGKTKKFSWAIRQYDPTSEGISGVRSLLEVLQIDFVGDPGLPRLGNPGQHGQAGR